MAEMQTHGTVDPAQSFNADQAAADLRKAMKGIGTDEAAIIRVLSSHNNAQRQEISASFKTQYGKLLKDELKSELSGNFEKLVLALIEAPRDYDAKELEHAVKGLGTKEGILIEILCSRSNAEIQQIKERYKFWFKRDLEKDVMGDTSGCFKRLLVSRLAANRDENPAVDKVKADQDADDFHKAGAGKLGTDESEFNRILCLRSHPQLREMFNSYRAKYGKEIEQDVKSETSGSIQEGFLAVVKVAKNTPAYFAERLYKSMKGAGTDDRTLIRVVVSRSEVDMAQIKQEFQKAYGKTLGDFIKGDAGGDYKKLLLALCKEA